MLVGAGGVHPGGLWTDLTLEHVSATYDSRRASWYEAMGIMPLAFSPSGSGPDPFAGAYKSPDGRVTHGHLDENRNHGGLFSGLADPRRLLGAPVPAGGRVAIRDFLYSRGDLLRTGVRRRPPAVRQGRSLTFVNRDAPRSCTRSPPAGRRATGRRGPVRRRAIRDRAVRLRQPRSRRPRRSARSLRAGG